MTNIKPEDISGDAKSIVQKILKDAHELTTVIAVMESKVRHCNAGEVVKMLVNDTPDSRTNLPWIIMGVRLQLATLDKVLAMVNESLEARRIDFEVAKQLSAPSN